MRLLLILVLISLLNFRTEAQSLIAKIELKSDFFTTDNLGNVYVVKGHEFKKYDSNGKFIITYSDKSLGRITSVDATNFLKILLFYQDFSRILFMDNMLAPTSPPLNLQKIQLEQTTVAASSHDNGMWLYDQIAFQAMRFDQNLRQTHQTGNLMQLLGIELNPNFMLETNNMFFINNPSTGVLVFDVFGTYNKTIPVRNLITFQVIDNRLFYFRNQKLFSINLRTMEESSFNVPNENAIDVRIEKKRLYLLGKDFIEIYSLD
jgi:hypothetical protein